MSILAWTESSDQHDMLSISAACVPAMRALTRVRTQGEEHRRLRAALSVGFTAAAVSEYQAALERIARRVGAYHST